MAEHNIHEPNIGALAAAAQRARLVLRFPRQARFDMVREHAGSDWSEEGSRREVLLNLLSLYISIVGRKLIANHPRAMLSTWNKAARPTVTAMEAWGNKQIEQTRLAETLQRAVTDSLFSMGIVKVGLASTTDAAHVAWNLRGGEPFAQVIDLDDFVFDVHARHFEHCSFIGHRHRVPYEAAKRMYGKRKADQLQVSEDRIYNMEGDERINILGQTTLAGSDTEEFEPMVDLWEFYLPRHRLIVTLQDDNLTGAAGGYDADRHFGKALDIKRWLGPDCGPYHILGMGTVPGNTRPKAPIQDLYRLHLAINRCLRKLVREADFLKTVTACRQGTTDDGARILEANDQDIIRVDNPEQIKTIQTGGPNQQLILFFNLLKDLFSWLAGNLDIMGGLSPQAKTAHQDEMLNQNSSATLSEMQDRVVSFSGSVIKALCWYWHHDPQKVMRSQHSLPGLPEISITRRVDPQRRQRIPWEDIDVRVDPYSLPYQTPQGRLQALTQLITQIYVPMAQMFQGQGIALDLNAFTRLFGKYSDQPDVADLFTVIQPPTQEPAGPGASEGPTKPADTSREYIRRSLGGESPQAKQADLQSQLQAAQPPSANGTPVGAT